MKTLPFYLTNQSGYKNFSKKCAQAIRPAENTSNPKAFWIKVGHKQSLVVNGKTILLPLIRFIGAV